MKGLLPLQLILYLLQWQSVSSSWYCRYQSLLHSSPQQNFRQLFFSFWKVWGYPTSLISWFINFNMKVTITGQYSHRGEHIFDLPSAFTYIVVYCIQYISYSPYVTIYKIKNILKPFFDILYNFKIRYFRKRSTQHFHV